MDDLFWGTASLFCLGLTALDAQRMRIERLRTPQSLEELNFMFSTQDITRAYFLAPSGQDTAVT